MPRRSERSGRRRGAARGDWWTRLDADELLDVPIRDLGLAIEGTALETRLARLARELERAGLRFRPYAWLSSDWFTPDDCTGFALPFVLAHPRLARLERQHMLAVEGGAQEECMRLLRHETGHAIDNAYGLRRRALFRRVFGPVGEPYDDSYVPDPASREYVLNLDAWYSQSHPLEDFAETFAVWLRPGWEKRYADWPALAKLRYVDALMAEIRAAPPALRTRRREDPVSSLRLTLREYFERKQAFYESDPPAHHDESLRRVFASGGRRESAARFLRRRRSDLRRRVALGTGQHAYLVDQLLGEMITRSRQLGLRLAGRESDAFVDACILLTTLSMNRLQGPRARYYR